MPGSAEGAMFAEEATDTVNFVKQLHAAQGSTVTSEDVERTETCAKSGDLEGIVSVVLSRLDSVFAHADEDEVKGFFHILGSMLAANDKLAHRALVMKLASEATANQESDKRLRLTIVVSLLNTLPYSSTERRELFLLLLRYAAATSQLPLLYPFINELPKHLETWGATPEQRCALHSTVAEVLREAGERTRARQELMNAVEVAEPANAESLAVQCVSSALQDPIATQRESLVHKAAIKALKGGKHDALFRLLEIVSTGSVSDYEAFHAAHPGAVSAAGLEHTALLRAMRLLTLCSACSTKASLSYAEVAEAISVPEADVESWLIDGIDAKVIDVQINEADKAIAVLRTSPRVFSEDQWGGLAAKLSQWKDSVESLLSAVQSARSDQQV